MIEDLRSGVQLLVSGSRSMVWGSSFGIRVYGVGFMASRGFDLRGYGSDPLSWGRKRVDGASEVCVRVRVGQLRHA